MKGLILKDIYNMKGMARALLILVVIFALAFRTQGMASMVITFTITSTILIVNSLAIDEVTNWYQMAFTMPVKRSRVVLAKYLVSALFSGLGILLGTATWMILQAAGFTQGMETNLTTAIAIIVVAFLMALFMISLIMPINLKFGVQKARLLLLAVVALPILMISLMTVLGLVFPGIMFYGGFKLGAYAIVFITLAVVAAAAIGSYFLSVRIMEKKEF